MTKDERNEIAILLKKKYSLRSIANVLGRSVSNISLEIKRNSVRNKYDPKKASHKAYVRRRNVSFQGKSIVKNKELRDFVDNALLEGQSAKAIAGRLKNHHKGLPYVSKDTIYRYLKSPHGRMIGLRLKKRRKNRYQYKTRLKDRTFIAKRPAIINQRKRMGDAEADFIVSGKGGKGILLVVVDRKIRIAFLEIIHKVTIINVHKAFLEIKKRFPEMKTLTLDNDILFRQHKELTKLLGVKIYFCNPYHSWEKGTVENTNKYIRRYIPKGSNLSKYDRYEISMIEKALNNRYMECLDYKTPEEKLMEYRRRNKKQGCSI